jgi:hypothetical protein
MRTATWVAGTKTVEAKDAKKKVAERECPPAFQPEKVTRSRAAIEHPAALPLLVAVFAPELRKPGTTAGLAASRPWQKEDT